MHKDSDELNQPAAHHAGNEGDALQKLALPEALASLGIPAAVLKNTGQVIYANAAFSEQVCSNGLTPSANTYFDVLMRESFQSLPADFGHRLLRTKPFTLRLADGVGEQVWQFSFGALVRGCRVVCFYCLSGQGAGSTIQECESELDPLTGLGNRKRFMRLVDELEPPTDARPRAVMRIDLDKFKQVNDTLGHGVGDRLLKLAASRLQRALRPSDPLMRLHGDEFIVLLEGEIDRVRAVGLGERVVDLMGRTFLVNGQQVEVGASVGIALSSADVQLWGDLVRQSDLALLASKQAGRACVTVFTAELEQRAKRRRQLELALRKALLENEMRVVYQPQVSLGQGRITGFEALLRWSHPDLGEIAPETFIPLAEGLGEIHKIGRWVLKQACIEALNWPSALTVAVNASPLQIATQDFADTVAQTLQEVGLPAHRLEIEITEKMLLEPSAAVQIKALTEMGVGIALDDFGSGYSALSYLNQYRFSKIKLDQSFFRSSTRDVCESLMKILISLGRALSVPVVAEGVESIAICEALRRQGCDAVQGFLISKPLQADRIPQLFSEYNTTAIGVVACEE